MATKVSLPSESGSSANEEDIEWKNIDFVSKNNEMIEWTVEDTPIAEIKWNDNSMIDDDPLLSSLLSPDDEMAVEIVDEGRRPTIEIEDPSTVSPSSNSDKSMLIVAHRIGSGVGRVGSGSRTQWDSLEEGSITMPLGGLVGGGGERAATKELDLALALSTHDKMSINLSEASYTSQATEIACNVSRSSSYSSSRNIPAKQVTPPSSKDIGRTRGSKKKKSDRISEEINDIMLPQDDDTLPTEPPQPRPLGRMFMCGAVHVDEDLKDSLQDVNTTIQQIYTTNRTLIKNMNQSFRKKVGLNIDTVEEESFGDREQQQSTGSFVEDTFVKRKKNSRPSSDIQRRLV